jgi:hypothetical protein
MRGLTTLWAIFKPVQCLTNVFSNPPQNYIKGTNRTKAGAVKHRSSTETPSWRRIASNKYVKIRQIGNYCNYFKVRKNIRRVVIICTSEQ